MTGRNRDFSCAIVIVGLLAGAAGLSTTLVLRFVEHLTYHYTFGSLLAGVTGSSLTRRAVGPMLGAALAGLGWWLLRKRAVVRPLAEAVASRDRIPLLPVSVDAGLQVLLVGSGASLGRESAPRQFAAGLADLATRRLTRLPAGDREILLACAAGAGLGAVYAVPLAGALFAMRLVKGRELNGLRALGTALITSSLAVAVGALATRDRPSLAWPGVGTSYLLAAHALALAPLTLLVGLAFNRLMAAARPAAPVRAFWLVPLLAAAGLLIGICSHWWPDLPGNGRSILTVSLNSGMTLTAAAVILVLKPGLTAVFLRAGGTGGMMTPALATGAAAGSLAVLAINSAAGVQIHVAAVSLAGAAGVLAVTQRAPVFAAVFVWELAHPPFWLLAVFLVAAVGAHGLRVLVNRIDALVARPTRPLPPYPQSHRE